MLLAVVARVRVRVMARVLVLVMARVRVGLGIRGFHMAVSWRTKTRRDGSPVVTSARGGSSLEKTNGEPGM
ncbi:MAG: hypothetical protein H7138_23675 [Myxococcales bacterium]|nr:hypothetical protein [Myxococcales bacterium]